MEGIRARFRPLARGLWVALFGLVFGLVGAPRAAAEDKPAPEKWAGMDVGARGIKPVVLSFAKTAAGWDFNADTTIDTRNTELGSLLDDNSGFDPKRFEATVTAIAELDRTIREKHALPAERVRIVVSSGVFTRFKDKEVAAKARKELSAAVEKATGRAPDFITEQQEAEFAARGAISPTNRAGRMVVDIGSGNSRFGWYTETGFQHFTIDSGTKAFRDAVAKRADAKKQPFAAAATELAETVLAAPMRANVAKAVGFDKITDVQIFGGASWALATYTHPGTGSEARVPVTAADVEKFAELARLSPEDARKKILKGLTTPAAQAAGAKEIERVQKVFTPEDLQAAAEILRVSFAEGKLASKKVAFFQSGQYAWIAGYLMAAAKLPE
jgi:hypothetical protein